MNRTIFAAIAEPKHLQRTDVEAHDAGDLLCIYTHAAIMVLGGAIAADRGILLEPLWVGIIAAATIWILDKDPCMMRQTGPLQRMGEDFVDSLIRHQRVYARTMPEEEAVIVAIRRS